MFMHLLKLVWKRKTRHLLLSVELALSFMLVFAVVLVMLFVHNLRSLPLGYTHDDVWAVQIQPTRAASAVPDAIVTDAATNAAERPEGVTSPAHTQTAATGDTATLLKQVKQLVRTLPEVEHSAFVGSAPFVSSSFITSIHEESNADANHRIEIYELDEDASTLMNMPLEEGRWFTAAELESGQFPVVINRKFADTVFPGESAIDKTFVRNEAGNALNKRFRVVGVMSVVRPRGEYQTISPLMLMPLRITEQLDGQPATLLVKLRAGTERAFEMRLLESLQRAQPGWSFEVKALSDLVSAERADMSTTVLILMLISGFMFLMVSFGLFGVLWQHTTQRITEFGLRRALGATAQGLQAQLIAEQLLLSLLSMLAATLLLIQIPITGIMGELLSWPLFIMSLLTAAALILLLSTLCAWYPAWRAGRLSPVVALRYE